MSTFNDMVNFLDTAWCARKFIVPCLEGPVGIGKTAAVMQHAENVKAGKVVTIIASQVLPNEVSGITMPVPESKAMEIFDHYRLSSLEDGDILFFDELLEADELVLRACLTLIESRQMMSGKILPDIQIVAATNPSIKPNMLKENIRQRFVWKKFDLDPRGCREYIKELCGFDIGYDLTMKICSSGNEYNILTQRSLTKMAQWISLAENDDERNRIAEMIDGIWNMSIGLALRDRWQLTNSNSMETQMRQAIRNSIEHAGLDRNSLDVGFGNVIYDDDNFDNASLEEIMNVLKSLPQWDMIRENLESIEVESDENDGEVIKF